MSLRFSTFMNDASIRQQKKGRVPGAINGAQSRSIGSSKKPGRRLSTDQADPASEKLLPISIESPAVLANALKDSLSSPSPHRQLIEHFADGRLEPACEMVMELLTKRISSGDVDLIAAKLLLEACVSLISTMPPLSHVSTLPLRPDDRLYSFFDQFLSLLRQQEIQMQQLQMMISELI